MRNNWNKQIGFATILTVILCWAAAALAAPSATDIETLINKGDLTGARSGIEQVIREKPNSAKAYYLYAQILHAQRQGAQARQALSTAERLNPAMDFASPGYLAKLKAELGLAGTAGALATGSPATTKPTSGGWGLLPWVGLGVIVLGVVVYMRSRERRRRWREQQLAATGNPLTPRRDESLDRFAGSGSVGPTGPMYGPTPPPAGGRPGLTGAATGFLAGLAGGALADSLLNRGHASTTPPAGPTPTESPLNPAPDQESKPAATNFDMAGLGDDWGGSDSNAASDTSSNFDTPSDFDSGDDSWS
jgi:hypothetical protein